MFKLLPQIVGVYVHYLCTALVFSCNISHIWLYFAVCEVQPGSHEEAKQPAVCPPDWWKPATENWTSASSVPVQVCRRDDGKFIVKGTVAITPKIILLKTHAQVKAHPLLWYISHFMRSTIRPILRKVHTQLLDRCQIRAHGFYKKYFSIFNFIKHLNEANI